MYVITFKFYRDENTEESGLQQPQSHCTSRIVLPRIPHHQCG